VKARGKPRHRRAESRLGLSRGKPSKYALAYPIGYRPVRQFAHQFSCSRQLKLRCLTHRALRTMYPHTRGLCSVQFAIEFGLH
jgi:hypothetical protein